MSALEQKVSIYFQFAFFAPSLKLLLYQNPMLEGDACFFTALRQLLDHRPASFHRPLPSELTPDQKPFSTALIYLNNSQGRDPAVKAIEGFREYVDGRRLSPVRKAEYERGYSFLLRCAARIVDDCRREAKAQARHRP